MELALDSKRNTVASGFKKISGEVLDLESETYEGEGCVRRAVSSSVVTE